ncbi:MAG: HAD family hydrolase [Pseudomonadota bacterium]|nr:HAD family hydrolase [Pseudomonadota bacterium]
MKAILFDIDGTLVDSNDLHVQAWLDAFREFGKELALADLHQQMGKGGDQLIPVFCSPAEVERFGSALEARRVEIFTRKYAPRVRPLPKVRELFERMHREGLRIALASSAKASEVKAHAQTLGVTELVEASTSADDVEHSKPCPDIFEAALATVSGVAPDEAIVIGDTPYDVIAAQRAGLRTVAVLSGGFAEKDLLESGAVELYRDVADLLARYDESIIARERPQTASFVPRVC